VLKVEEALAPLSGKNGSLDLFDFIASSRKRKIDFEIRELALIYIDNFGSYRMCWNGLE
jgi:hypothetical protein